MGKAFVEDLKRLRRERPWTFASVASAAAGFTLAMNYAGRIVALEQQTQLLDDYVMTASPWPYLLASGCKGALIGLGCVALLWSVWKVAGLLVR